ncbi:MAG: zinc ABC transporter substrate-binding protein [Acidiferrobacterales bacterium]
MVASIAPVHSLVAAVMAGIGEPTLLVRGYGSPHAYQLRPSDAARLSEATVVFRIDASLETFLQKPLSSLGDKALVVDLMETKGINLLRNREAGAWGRPQQSTRENYKRHTEHKERELEHHHGQFDAHVWLDPDNAKRMVDEIVRTLSHVDPANAKAYASNGVKMVQRIVVMDREAERKLATVRDIPYVVFHDAYQYLETHYALNAIGSITVSPDRMPSARRLREIRSTIKELHARCVFGEPQFESALIKTIVEGTDADRGVLDPQGSAFEPGPDVYLEMMKANVSAIVGCLSK